MLAGAHSVPSQWLGITGLTGSNDWARTKNNL